MQSHEGKEEEKKMREKMRKKLNLINEKSDNKKEKNVIESN